MTAPNGKSFERLVAAIHQAESSGAKVKWNDSIDRRQFDVTIRFKHGLHHYLTVIECKNYSSNVPVEKVEAFVTKARDAKANKAVMVCSHGFQSGCTAVADRYGVQLLVLTEKSDLAELVARITPALQIFDVSFASAAGQGVIEFEDWGGKLAYLMKHSRLILQGGTGTINQFLDEWQLTSPELEFERLVNFELPLPQPCKLWMPRQQPVPVTTMRFTCSLVNAQVVEGAGLDAHILEGMFTRLELRDPQGNLHHSASMKNVPIGFDQALCIGKFYEQPTLFSRYVCDKIEGDAVTWTLLESYQHCELVQATYTQNRKYAAHYVEVVDSKIIQHLNALLSEIERRR